LLASARRVPEPRAARVTPNPAKPTTPFTQTSACDAIEARASGADAVLLIVAALPSDGQEWSRNSLPHAFGFVLRQIMKDRPIPHDIGGKGAHGLGVAAAAAQANPVADNRGEEGREHQPQHHHRACHAERLAAQQSARLHARVAHASRIRGSSHAYSRSTARLSVRKISAITNTIACTVG